MDENQSSISRVQLYATIGSAAAPMVLDVRREEDLESPNRLIASACRRSPEGVEEWARDLPRDRLIVVYCTHGREVSQKTAAALRAIGFTSVYLEGGIADWARQGLPTRRENETVSHKWITRERPKIDRIACPWLIRRFIDPNAQFLYVPTEKVIGLAKELGVTPYDIEGVEFAHEGDRCSFDTIIRIYEITDAPLDHLAKIVRGADTSRHDLSPQCGGLFAISLGLSANFPNDHEMLAHGMVMYDALYTWCRSLQAETHNWPAKTPATVAT
jgi:rhodanese-related sulfurtransferase